LALPSKERNPRRVLLITSFLDTLGTVGGEIAVNDSLALSPRCLRFGITSLQMLTTPTNGPSSLQSRRP